MKNKILFVISLLFGLMFIHGGLNKFFNYAPPPKDMPQELLNAMTSIMELGWLMPLIAVAEIIGGILIIPNKTRALGAIIIFPVLIGIVLFNITSSPSTLPIGIILLAINLWVIFENREKYIPMVR